MSKAAPIEAALKCKMAERKWKLERVARLLPAFVRPTEVTPFFLPRVLSRHGAWCQIDGYVGVLDRRFEDRWLRGRKPKRNTFALVLYIANIDRLRASENVSFDPQSAEFAAFTNAMLDLLEGAPHDKDALRKAFATERLMGQ